MSQAPPAQTFDAALQQALALTTRRRIAAAGAATALVVVFFVVVLATTKSLIVAAQALLFLPPIWYLALNGGKTVRKLKQLKGGQPQHWLPSTSHGVLVLDDTAVVGGGLYGALDRHAETSVASVAYDEARHVITVDVRHTSSTSDGMHTRQEHTTVHFDEQVSPAQAEAFAKLARERSAR